ERNPSMPEVPTTAQAGLPGYAVESWFALFAPARTPQPVINQLAAELRRIVASDGYRKQMEEQGAFAAFMGPDELGRFVDQELAAWARIIRESNITTQ
ncbi:Bug family tripartite tricarboxylate transporter substrate binding protein, partial [Escherichia coli]|uniref:Bug family tripartite tricarboxylate transporter substrate binding protein n=2 Tax=Escherichia coli TaxID=562 RepID=UPI002284B065